MDSQRREGLLPGLGIVFQGERHMPGRERGSLGVGQDIRGLSIDPDLHQQAPTLAHPTSGKPSACDVVPWS